MFLAENRYVEGLEMLGKVNGQCKFDIHMEQPLIWLTERNPQFRYIMGKVKEQRNYTSMVRKMIQTLRNSGIIDKYKKKLRIERMFKSTTLRLEIISCYSTLYKSIVY
ncbi:unnamed protein product (macronuclear) [Paramecium tetraurelia]|uniref:Uncharacterized protein n=1 Tax=Paramecium tetraurelia TaxID=5888 RepID=A0CDM6_PARTE|nr:uncharacterized protein GSPATT00007104001 [Paramecium tetraurelia]CAK68893.1 unnamed protein product [Paramecium tetraurelia]|eukprot:XP_001436290.1 hypothetical protein (macronuclear) [Paramecium tetraurelia strain d4-2]